MIARLTIRVDGGSPGDLYHRATHASPLHRPIEPTCSWDAPSAPVPLYGFRVLAWSQTCSVFQLCDFRSRGVLQVEPPGVFFQHPAGREGCGHRADRLLHPGGPTAGNPLRVAVVVERDDMPLQVVVKRGGGRSVVVPFDGPAVALVVPLIPPTVRDTEVGNPVEAGLLAAGPRSASSGGCGLFSQTSTPLTR